MSSEGEKPPIVFVATPMYGGMAAGIYTASLLQAVGVMTQNGLGLCYSYRTNDSLVTRARNDLAEEFLQSPATHLMWIDADIGFNPIDIVNMVKSDRDIICGLYPKKTIDWGRVEQSVKDGAPKNALSSCGSVSVVNHLDGAIVDGLMEVASAGTGFMLIKREVLDALSEHVHTYRQDEKIVKEFYATSIDERSGTLLSEDYHFCKSARSLGFKVYAAPHVQLRHAGMHVFG